MSAGTVDSAKQTLEALLKQCNEPQTDEVHKSHCHNHCELLRSEQLLVRSVINIISGKFGTWEKKFHSPLREVLSGLIPHSCHF